MLQAQHSHVAVHVVQPVEPRVDEHMQDGDALLLPVHPLEVMLPHCHHQALQEFPDRKNSANMMWERAARSQSGMGAATLQHAPALGTGLPAGLISLQQPRRGFTDLQLEKMDF